MGCLVFELLMAGKKIFSYLYRQYSERMHHAYDIKQSTELKLLLKPQILVK